MRLRPRYEEIDLRMQQLRIGLQAARPGWRWDITANWAEVAVGKATVLRIRATCNEDIYSTHVPFDCLFDEQIAASVSLIMASIDASRAG